MRKRYIVNPEVEGIIDDMTAQDAIKVIGGDGEPDLTVQTACTNNTPPPSSSNTNNNSEHPNELFPQHLD